MAAASGLSTLKSSFSAKDFPKTLTVAVEYPYFTPYVVGNQKTDSGDNTGGEIQGGNDVKIILGYAKHYNIEVIFKPFSFKAINEQLGSGKAQFDILIGGWGYDAKRVEKFNATCQTNASKFAGFTTITNKNTFQTPDDVNRETTTIFVIKGTQAHTTVTSENNPYPLAKVEVVETSNLISAMRNCKTGIPLAIDDEYNCLEKAKAHDFAYVKPDKFPISDEFKDSEKNVFYLRNDLPSTVLDSLNEFIAAQQK